jgi:glucose/arabinose dehydrogenase
MPLNLSKLVILTLLVIFLFACKQHVVTDQPTPRPTLTPSVSPTLPIPPFPTALKPTETQFPTHTAQLTSSATATPTWTPLPANVSDIPDPEGYTWELLAEGFSRPTGLASPKDSSGRLFVLEQSGLIHIIAESEVFPIPFLDLRDRVNTKGSTVRGLQGMTFHPNYAQNGYFYLHYTQNEGNSVIARYQVSGDPNLADPSSELRLMEISYPIGEHVGGGLEFGPDGYLYISIGDGGAAGNHDQAGNAQNPKTIPGSLLRLDVDNNTDPQVWAIGLRNPWRFSFDSLNGDLYIADVGENRWEEINYLPAGSPPGANFGWNFFEGDKPFQGLPPNDLELTKPILTYDHTYGCSVTGGYVYRGQSLPTWFGVYLYGDYCSGIIWGLLKNPDSSWQNKRLFQLPAYITSFGQDPVGELYFSSINGKIYKLTQKSSQ